MIVMWFLSQKNIMYHYFGSFCLRSLLICKVLLNDLFLIRRMRFFVLIKNLLRGICLCLLKIFLVFVWRFVLIYPIDCVCGVITRSYFLLFISQLSSLNVCLFPKLSSDIRFRMTDAIFGFVIYKA